jgi:hypothetical protein
MGQSVWLETIGVGLTLWEGQFGETVNRLWLRWCDRKGQVILAGAEQADAEQLRADAEQLRAERFAERLRELGEDPDSL